MRYIMECRNYHAIVAPDKLTTLTMSGGISFALIRNANEKKAKYPGVRADIS